jgi:hypothetical protein
MSWSVSAIGKPAAVAAKVAADLAQYRCTEPEEAVRQLAGTLLSTALCAQHPDSVVQVSASGSQSNRYVDGKVDGWTNSLEVKVQPLSGFVE